MNSLDVLQSLEDERGIRIAVIPIGEISQYKFKEYASMIKSFDVVRMRHLTSREALASSGSPIGASKAFPSLSVPEGELILNFDDGEVFRSDWEELQAYRKIYGVIGVVDCQRYKGDLSYAIKDFKEVLLRFPTYLHSVCFAFEPSNDQPDMGLSSNNFIMIPNNPDKKRLLFYINTWILDFSDQLLSALENVVLNNMASTDNFNVEVTASSNTNTTISSTYISTPLDFSRTPEEISKLKKRKPGRKLKILGDYCLLASSPLDALEYYKEAIEITKTNNDYEWVASCLEGIAAATLARYRLMTKHNQPVDDKDSIENAIIDKLNESITFYSKKKALILQIETILKLAKFFSSPLSKTANSQNKHKLLAAEQLENCYRLASSLSTQFKIMITTAIANEFKTLGMPRKMAFYLRETAVFYHKIFNFHSAQTLLLLSAHVYNVNLGGKKLKDSDNWPSLQKSVLKDLIVVSKSSNDFSNEIKQIVYLLRKLNHVTSENTQKALVADLELLTMNHPPLCNFIDDMTGLPQLIRVTPLKVAEGLDPHELVQAATEKSIFIVSQFRKKKEKKIMWVANEEVFVSVVVSNSMAFPIPLQAIALNVDGVQFENIGAFVKKNVDQIVIGAFEKDLEIVLVGKCMTPGSLVIKGVDITVFNITSTHPVDSNSGYGLMPFGRGTVAPSKSIPPIPADAKITNIVVAPPLPTLHIFTQHTLASSVIPFGSNETTDATITLLDGEQTTWDVIFDNIGALPITFMNLTVQNKRFRGELKSSYDIPPVNEAEMEQSISFDPSIISDSLPFQPSSRIVLPLSIFASYYSEMRGAILKVEYGTQANTTHSRKKEIHLSFNIIDGPHLSGFDIIPSTPLDNIAISQVNMALEITNPTTSAIQVFCSTASPKADLSPITLLPFSQKRFLVTIDRYWMENEEESVDVTLPPSRYSPRSRKKVPPLTAIQTKQQKDFQWAKLELKKRLKLNWVSLEFDRKGVLVLHQITFTPEMALQLIPEPVTVDIIFERERINLPSAKRHCPSNKYVVAGFYIARNGDNSDFKIDAKLKVSSNNHTITNFFVIGSLHSQHKLDKEIHKEVKLWLKDSKTKIGFQVFITITKASDPNYERCIERCLSLTGDQ